MANYRYSGGSGVVYNRDRFEGGHRNLVLEVAYKYPRGGAKQAINTYG